MIYESLSSYLSNSIKGNQSTRILLFDVDDTLIHTSAQIWIKSSEGSERSISNQEFNDYKIKPGEELDFREFNSQKILDNDIPTKYLNTLKKEYAKGTHIGIITARSDCSLIKRFLLKKGISIKTELIFAINDPQLGLEGSIQERKAQIIDHLIKSGYETLVFFDDNEGNLEAAKQLSGGKVKVITVKV